MFEDDLFIIFALFFASISFGVAIADISRVPCIAESFNLSVRDGFSYLCENANPNSATPLFKTPS